MDDVAIRSRWSWGLVAAAAALGAMSALYVAVTPACDQTPLANRTWEQFAAGMRKWRRSPPGAVVLGSWARRSGR